MRFYRDIMRPDFTLLITATPDDADIEKFRKAAGLGELHRIRVSRKDAVDAGLIKAGVRCIAYLAPDDQKALADIPGTALAEGWQTHQAIKAQLADIGVSLTPLMLVQVANRGKEGEHAINEARTKLLALGVAEEQIASYTADEPKDDLLAVALDERKEVLLFKMAVAMGFDAPRAFTVVSLRGAKSVDFGIQVVGRILRVHRRLQAMALDNALPDLLRFGYVFLADAESQGGLVGAGAKINAIETGLSAICNHALLVRQPGQAQVQYSVNGQLSLLPTPFVPPPWKPLDDSDRPEPPPDAGVNETLPGFYLPWVDTSSAKPGKAAPSTKTLPGNPACPLRADVPRRLQAERLPSSTDELLKGIAAYALPPEVLAVGLRKTVKITRKTIEDIFNDHREAVDSVQARLSRAELARRAQRVLFDAQAIDPRDLEAALLERLRLEYNDVGGMALNEEEPRQALHLILATYPRLLKDAERACLANRKKVEEAAPLPESVDMPPGAALSRLNGYGVMPQDLNEPERKFAELLDADTSGAVLWWLRNEPRKPWSVALVLPGGERYFPDFIVGVKDRARGGGVLLAEIKGGYILDSDDTRDKAQAEHKVYGWPLLLTRKDDGKFWIARYIAKENRVEPDQAFRVEHLGQY